MAEIVLTPEQQAVVDNRGGALLVSAAAGSGKTRVLIDRVLRRVSEEQANVDDFLMITFTQAAASELRGKLIARLSQRLADAPENRHLQRQLSRAYLSQISTVHSFCATLLREYAHLLDLPADFRVCNEQEAAMLRTRALQGVLEEAYAGAAGQAELAAALDMFGAGRTDAALPEVIWKVYDSAQCYRDAGARMEELDRMLDFSACADVVETVWGAFLLQEHRMYLDGCIRSMEAALAVIAQTPSLAPYHSTFVDNLALLGRLRAAESWSALRAIPLDFGRLKPVRKCDEPEKLARVKAARDRTVKGVRSRMERFVLPSDEALRDLSCSAGALRGLLTLTKRFAAAYRAEKLRRHLLDYNDLEHDTLRLLIGRDGAPTAAAREIAGRFTEIMVDEYQDTNAVQDTIFQAISRSGQNLFFVGDVKQSIYRFRLADPGIFLQKYRDFVPYTEASPGEPRKILLSDNFRSHPEILEAANEVFRLTMTERVGGLRYGDAEALRARRVMPDLGSPAVELHCIDMDGLPSQPPVPRAEIEAEFIARRIEEMLQNGESIPDGEGLRPIRPEDIVILMRALSSKAAIYLRALRRHGIRGLCGSGNLFESEEAQLLIALLQVIDNPHQDIPLLTVLLSPLFAYSADTLAALRARHREGDLFDALNAAEEGEAFLRQLGAFRDLAQTSSLRGLLDGLEEQLFFRALFRGMEGGEQRLANLDALFSLADDYEGSGRYGLSGFLRYLDALREKGISAGDASPAGAVQLMTVHKSKGMEFPVVFLADLCKKFNTGDAASAVYVDTELGLGANVYDMEHRLVYPTVARTAIAARLRREDVSEEMRVLYVAMTRPQYRLIMTCCARSMKRKLSDLARDLTIPADEALLEQAGSMSDWILMTALTHTEAGALFAVGGYPEARHVPRYPWRITYRQGAGLLPQDAPSAPEQASQPPLLLEPKLLRYPHAAATAAPSKITATQLKGRDLDSEASEDAPSPLPPRFPHPQFTRGARPLSPAERGTAIHLAMQYLRYEACTSLAGVESELKRLVEQRFLTPQQGQAVPPEKLLRFFTSALGGRVLTAEQVVREFKFSVLEDAALLDGALAGEQLLLQGVTDCCLIEPGGLTILDFKSDHLRPGEEAGRAAYYRSQLHAYSRALARIFSLPVQERILYFFATDTAVSVE